MGRQDSLDAAEAISVFDFGVEDLFVPMASGTLEGAGYYDPEKAVSRFATPLDFSQLQSIAPPTGWEGFHTLLDELTTRMLAQGALDEAIAWAESVGLVTPATASGKREITFGLHLMASHPGDFATGMGMGYSDYIQGQAQSYVDLVVEGLPWMFNAYVCAGIVRVDQASLAPLVADHLRGLPNSQLDQAIEALENWVGGGPPTPMPGLPPLDCHGLLEAIKGLRTALDAFMSARDWLLQDIGEIYEDLGYVALFVGETLRSREFYAAIADALGAGDPEPARAETIGRIYGTLIGVVVWEIIEEVVTGGLGKGARILKLVP